ncbi:MAG: hypothetical protein O2971_12825 [Proteobacteria bacterium]|nr:hypothetical protein [Pseudomonadota bacterium]
MRKFRINRENICLLVGIFFVMDTVLSLESDNIQPVLFSSDGNSTMKIEGNTRILKMSDSVKVTQGTLEILGNEATFEYSISTNELTRVTVHGTPVHYQQQLDEDGSLVKGTSDTLLFYTDEFDNETILELIGNANIESPDSTMRCAAITYVVDRDLIREANGPCEGMLSTAQE